ncbi:formate dehydrogenase accessory sulfurtransferase FdhD [Streptomyces fuscichromogenes]|uniref:Sulfurtransferase FdhD n=1 Tax=Streptomyces fuscichromogenes TaxID=1324013 RepID=A0A918CTE3_9ACTN|nr:formate dehydrogenase accessory sulfurtransferase FdhD [Streptomyces fuscichromogenes]GGN20315.1 sulfurtransferase FdhD [Streptomyces fuscichromogenes]
MRRVTERRRVLRLRDGAVGARPDTLVAEELLEIRLGGRPLAITMRTPGDDRVPTAGFLVSEGFLGTAEALAGVVSCTGASQDGLNSYQVLDVQLSRGVPAPGITPERDVYTTSSCGPCGKADAEAMRATARRPIADAPAIRQQPGPPAAFPDRLPAAQRLFDRAGGHHAAALFALDGGPPDLCAGMSRRNAVDELTGAALRSDALPLSGRASFELVRKAVMADIPVPAALSTSPSASASVS